MVVKAGLTSEPPLGTLSNKLLKQCLSYGHNARVAER
jgi:hypothetical protein